MSRGNFFAIGKDQFKQACNIGLNEAVALLVLSRGTLKDHSTTKWSSKAIFEYTGLSRRKAKQAIEQLEKFGLLRIARGGNHPTYKLNKPKEIEDFYWLPNELIDSASSEVPPVRKLRERGDLILLETFISLYGVQDLDNDGGIPRSLIWAKYDREFIARRGNLAIYGFSDGAQMSRSAGPFQLYGGKVNDQGDEGAWIAIKPLTRMGLITNQLYVAESDCSGAELLYPINSETSAANNAMIQFLYDQGFVSAEHRALSYEKFAIVPEHIENASLATVFQLRYRPHTGKTARWYAMDREKTEAHVNMIRHVVGGARINEFLEETPF